MYGQQQDGHPAGIIFLVLPALALVFNLKAVKIPEKVRNILTIALVAANLILWIVVTSGVRLGSQAGDY